MPELKDLICFIFPQCILSVMQENMGISSRIFQVFIFVLIRLSERKFIKENEIESSSFIFDDHRHDFLVPVINFYCQPAWIKFLRALMRLTFGCVNEDFSTEEYLRREDLFWMWEAPFLLAGLLDLIKMEKGEGQLSASIPCSLFLVCQTVRSSSQCSHLHWLHHAFLDIMDWPSSEEILSFHNLLHSSYFVTTTRKRGKCKVGPHRKSP